MSSRLVRRRSALAAWLLALCPAWVSGHAGPPFPILENRAVGAYSVSIWTDPDATDDGSARGQFWVIVDGRAGEPDARTVVTLKAAPLDRAGAEREATATRVAGTPPRYFAALLLDHEGEFRISVQIGGPMGQASTVADVAATYDLRPSLSILPWLLLPFLLVGLLWLKALRTGRRLPPTRG